MAASFSVFFKYSARQLYITLADGQGGVSFHNGFASVFVMRDLQASGDIRYDGQSILVSELFDQFILIFHVPAIQDDAGNVGIAAAGKVFDCIVDIVGSGSDQKRIEKKINDLEKDFENDN